MKIKNKNAYMQPFRPKIQVYVKSNSYRKGDPLMKQKHVPLDKQSKRKRKDFYASLRGNWGGLDPTTRKSPNPRSLYINFTKKCKPINGQKPHKLKTFSPLMGHFLSKIAMNARKPGQLQENDPLFGFFILFFTILPFP